MEAFSTLSRETSTASAKLGSERDSEEGALRMTQKRITVHENEHETG